MKRKLLLLFVTLLLSLAASAYGSFQCSVDGITYNCYYDYNGNVPLYADICSFYGEEVTIPLKINAHNPMNGEGDGIYEVRMPTYCVESGNRFVRKITFPSNFKRIPSGFFRKWQKLEEVNCSQITYIGSGAFRECDLLETFNIPNSVDSICDYAFLACKKLKNINLTQYLSGGVFYTINVIPNSVKYLGSAVFANCSSLKSLRLPQNITVISPSLFENCHNLETVEFQRADTIGERAFDHCINLPSFRIPNGCKYIGKRAFQGCLNLPEITIPNSVTTIGEQAFCNCISVKEVNVSWKEPISTYHSAFEINIAYFEPQMLSHEEILTLSQKIKEYDQNHIYNNVELGIAGNGDISKYKTTAPWSSFSNIIESQSGDSGYSISINSSNFPDEKFREYVSGTSIDKDGSGTLDDEEIAAVTTIDVNNLAISDMKGIEFFTALTTLNCRFTNIKSIDLSNNIALKDLDCRNNNLTSLNVSNNTALTSLKCSRNKITSLDVSRNTQLTLLRCNYNKLTELDVSENTKLTRLDCYGNNIGQEKMGILVGSLPTVAGGKGQFYVIDTTLGDEANVCTTALVAAAKPKGWKVYNYNNGTSIEYAGSSAEPEPYAVLSSDGQTVTFYYDNQKASRGGVDINNSSIEYGDSSPYGTATTAVFDASFADYRPVSTAYWFMNCSSLKAINGIKNLNTSNVTSMYCMFVGCSGLTNLDVSGFNTSNVTNMSAMFSNCSGLTSLDLSSFNTSNVTSMDNMFILCSGLKSLDLSGFNTSNVTWMSWMFDGCSGLTSLDLSGFDTSNVTNMEWMFQDCSSLTSLDLSSFDTSNVGNMMSMFDGCSSLITIYAEETKWSTEGMTWHPTMFRNCTSIVGGYGTVYDSNNINSYYACIDKPGQPGYLTQKGEIGEGIAINKTNFPDTYFRNWVLAQPYGADGILTDEEIASVTCIDGITNVENFKGLELFTALKKLNCSWGHIRWDGQDATPISLDLSKNTALEDLNCSGYTIVSLDISKNTELTYLSCAWNKLTALDLSNNTKLKELQCWNNQITELNLSKNTALTTLVCTNNNLTSLVVAKNSALIEISCSVNHISGYEMDALIESLPVTTNGEFKVIDTSNEDEGNVCTKTQVAAAKAKGWTVLAYDGSNWVEYEGSEEGGGEPEPYAVLSSDGLTVTFYYDSNKVTRGGIDINNSLTGSSSPYGTATTAVFDVSFANYRPESTAYWFKKCSSLTTITSINNLNTSNVINMGGMFQDCSSLTSLDLKCFETSNVTNMSYMFYGCSSLTNLDLSSFITSNVTNMNSMFYGCSGLTSLDVSGFNTSNVTDMTFMFRNCYRLTNLDLSGFNTSNVTNMYCMFRNCYRLTNLDLSGFNTSNVTNMAGMFDSCSDLTTIYGDETKWSTESVTNDDNMFFGCTSLVGGNGTVYDANHIDVEYARIDKPGQQGYFTRKEPEMEPIDNADFSNDIDEDTDLDGNVVGDILYNISSGDGSYDSAEGCIVVTTPTDDTTIIGQDIFGEDFQSDFTGIVFKVPEGKGTVKVEAQTTGNMVLKVKIGDSDPVTMELEGRLKVSFPYNVTEPTYVYIYGGLASSAAPSMSHRGSASGELKLYGIGVTPDATGIRLNVNDNINENYYSLDGRKLQGKPTQKGLYVVNGRKVVIK